MVIEKIKQTPFLSYDDKNMLYADVADWDFCNPYGMQVIVGEEVVYEQNIFAPSFSMMVPCYEQDVTCTVRVTPFEDLPVEREFTLHPPKRWQIPLLYSSHEDLGYCAYIDKLHYECYEYLKVAMKLCEDREGFKYMIEHVWWLDAFDCYASEAEKEQLKRLMQEQKVELNAIHSGVHTSWANAEQLVRQMYFGCRDAGQKYGTRPECAIYVDLSGVSWPAVNAYAQMGIKYIAVFANNYRNSEEKMDFPPLFWWEDKAGKERMLFWYQRAYRPNSLGGIWCDTKRQYPEGEYFFDTTKVLRTEKWITERIEQLGNVEYDILPLSFYDDRELPTTMLLTVCEEMNRRWKYPRFRMEIPSVFLGEIADQYGDSLPVFRGDISEQWADFATSAPVLYAKRREVSRMFYDAEMLTAIQKIQAKEKQEDTEAMPADIGLKGGGDLMRGNIMRRENPFSRAAWSMGEFDEHCWASSSKHPQKMHRYNTEKVKVEPIEQAYADMTHLMDLTCGVPSQEKIGVISTIPRERRSSLRVGKEIPVPKQVRHQILPDGTVVTTPMKFQGVGLHNYEATLPFREAAEIKADVIETRYYTVSFSRTSQKITGILDKETGKELLDRGSRYELGQFIYLYSEGKQRPATGIEVSKKLTFRVYEGDVAYVIVQEGYEEQSGARVTAQFIFYKEEKNIDVDLSYKNAVGLLGDFYDRYKKNYFFAFPFLVEEPEFYTEMAAGEMKEKTERITINAADFTVTQNWVAAENEQGGVALYTRDMPVFHIGKLKFNHFGSEFEEDKAHFYLYASSNRCNSLIYDSIEACHAEYHLSILPYAGSHSEIVPVWSDQKDHRLLAGRATGADKEYLRLEQDNIRLVSMKKAEDCDHAIVLRFVETAGRGSAAGEGGTKMDVLSEAEGSVRLFFTPVKAMYADNCEQDRKEAEVISDTVHFRIRPWSYVTLKVYGEFI